jgi:hypothetical protein
MRSNCSTHRLQLFERFVTINIAVDTCRQDTFQILAVFQKAFFRHFSSLTDQKRNHIYQKILQKIQIWFVNLILFHLQLCQNIVLWNGALCLLKAHHHFLKKQIFLQLVPFSLNVKTMSYYFALIHEPLSMQSQTLLNNIAVARFWTLANKPQYCVSELESFAKDDLFYSQRQNFVTYHEWQHKLCCCYFIYVQFTFSHNCRIISKTTKIFNGFTDVTWLKSYSPKHSPVGIPRKNLRRFLQSFGQNRPLR